MTQLEGQAVVASPAMREVARQAKLFARTSAAVLLTGESGTGKEWIARLIHEASPRGAERYVRVNCAALPEALLESELFGHERGAFTGAVEMREGRIEWAGAGTLLLDEVSEIPVGLQAKLLRVLEEQEYQRLGGNEPRRVEARFIATSNRPLDQRVAQGEFRLDLLYRLNVLEIHVPPLRERPQDIAPLVQHFIERFQADAAGPIRGASDETLELLRSRNWPGNVRELRNVIHRACVVNTSGLIEPCDLPPQAQGPRLHSSPLEDQEAMRLDDIERNVILTNLRKFAGNKTAAAKHLGVSSRTLSNKMKRYQQLGYVG